MQVQVGSRTYDAGVLDERGMRQVAIPEIGSLTELTALFAGVRCMTIDGEPIDGYEVDSVVLMRSAASDLWDGRRATIVLREVV